MLRKIETESGFLAKQIESVQERQQQLGDVLMKLTRSLEHTEAQVRV